MSSNSENIDAQFDDEARENKAELLNQIKCVENEQNQNQRIIDLNETLTDDLLDSEVLTLTQLESVDSELLLNESQSTNSAQAKCRCWFHIADKCYRWNSEDWLLQV